MRNFKTQLNNPFLNKSFDIGSVDACTETFDLHLIDKTELDFSENLKIKARVPYENTIIGIDIVNYIICDACPKDTLNIYINDKKISHTNNYIKGFLEIYELVKNSTQGFTALIELDAKHGENFFYHYHQLVFYIIDEDHSDAYHYNIEVRRRKASKLNK